MRTRGRQAVGACAQMIDQRQFGALGHPHSSPIVSGVLD